MAKVKRSVLYAVYELLPVREMARFFVQTARIWHEHCSNIPIHQPERLKAYYAAFRAKEQSVLNTILAKLWEPENNGS